MRVLDGAEISQDDVLDLEFEAEGELLAALNEAYIKLLEFAHDREQRLRDRDFDERERATLHHVLHADIRLSDVESTCFTTGRPDASPRRPSYARRDYAGTTRDLLQW